MTEIEKDSDGLDQESEQSNTRERSSIGFPYVDLDDAIEVAKALHDKGGGSGTVSQLAAWLSHAGIDSGAFRMKVSAARLFGLITSDRKQVHITPLGRRIIQPDTQREAAAKAFLHVPLFRKVFEKYDGYQLPSDVGLESVLVNLGVAEKQKARARQVFQRSAQQAGFFDSGKTKLVMPVGGVGPTDSASIISQDSSGRVVERELPGAEIPDGKHELIAALYKQIPDRGVPWDADSRAKWLLTAKTIFDLIYET